MKFGYLSPRTNKYNKTQKYNSDPQRLHIYSIYFPMKKYSQSSH